MRRSEIFPGGELLGLALSSWYYEPTQGQTPETLALIRRIDRIYLEDPFYGSPRMRVELGRQGYLVNEKRVARLMRIMGGCRRHCRRHIRASRVRSTRSPHTC